MRYIPAGGKPVNALTSVHLSMNPGEVVGIIGESGSGKSTLAAATLRLLPAQVAHCAGSVMFEGREMLKMREAELSRVRGARIAMIPQDPATALNPVMKIGTQIAEVLRAHLPLHRRERKDYVLTSLQEVGFDDPKRIYSAYPHELSGGQRQRVVIAQAMACGPALVIADEPTTKLDPPLQAEVLALMSDMVRRKRTGLILITHDPATLIGFADRVAVMYAGRIVEEGSTEQIVRNPLHPYTQSLLRLFASESSKPVPGMIRLPVIAGEPPDLVQSTPGCRFEPRCPERMAACSSQDPRESERETSHRVSCFKYAD